MRKVLFTLIVSLLAFCSCSAGEEEVNKDASLKIDTEVIDFKKEVGSKDVQVTCNAEWSARVPADCTWCRLTKNAERYLRGFCRRCSRNKNESKLLTTLLQV